MAALQVAPALDAASSRYEPGFYRASHSANMVRTTPAGHSEAEEEEEGGIAMVKYHSRPSLQYRYEHYDPGSSEAGSN
jgi:hypothetical protein